MFSFLKNFQKRIRHQKNILMISNIIHYFHLKIKIQGNVIAYFPNPSIFTINFMIFLFPQKETIRGKSISLYNTKVSIFHEEVTKLSSLCTRCILNKKYNQAACWSELLSYIFASRRRNMQKKEFPTHFRQEHE